jgi:hypothetical protein
VQIGPDVYVDGGVIMNTPLSPPINAGAEVLHVIYMDPDLSLLNPESLQSTLGILDRVLTINFAAAMSRDAELAQAINHSLRLVDDVNAGRALTATSNMLKPFLKVAGRVPARTAQGAPPYRPLTIHRYHPHDDLGGILGMLDFDRPHIMDLIRRGFQDAVNHDCRQSGCTLDGREPWQIDTSTIDRRFGTRVNK